MAKICSAAEAIKQIRDGMSVMVGGFLDVGTPDGLVQALVNQGTENLTLITNDTAFPGKGVGLLLDAKRVKKLIASYIGGHPETGRAMESGELEVVLVPQGTLAEKIRAGGAGLGGLLTPTGIGTIASQGKQPMTIQGKTYLLELPLVADVALIKADKADTCGNLVYRRAARNFNPVMATAAQVVIAEVDEILPAGELDPDVVVTPGIFVDYLVEEGNGHARE